MASTRELRRRIRSVKNTSQITKAMQMVAATKMRRAQNQAISGRPYNQNLNHALVRLLPKLNDFTHPLLKDNESKNVGVLLLTTDKGLAGALNTNIFRAVQNFSKENANLSFYTVGKKGRTFVAKMGKNLIADFENHDLVSFRTAKQIARLLSESFLKKELGKAYITYPHFVSSLRQEPKIVQLLPIDSQEMFNRLSEMTGLDNQEKNKHQALKEGNEFLIEPKISELLNELLTHYLEISIFQGMMETKASEHSARMIAMKNATDNAKELVEDLTLAYNQTRQDNITRELLEITSAAAAME